MKIKINLLIWLLLSLHLSCNVKNRPRDTRDTKSGIDWLAEPAGEAGQYELFELKFTIKKTYNNPFDADEVAVDLVVKNDKGSLSVIPCFYTEEYAPIETGEKLASTGKYLWKARYTPDRPGNYEYHIRIRDKDGMINSRSGSLAVTGRDHKGFVRDYTKNYLLFEDGSPFFANGFNLCIPTRENPLDFEYFFRKWKNSRMNYTRLWLAPPWGRYAFAPEWTDAQFPSQKGKLGLKRYNQEVAARLDHFMQKAEEYGIYVMFCLGDERELETGIFRGEELPASRSFWHSNPYNRENGGPAASPLEFFVLEEAKSLYKNRLRYLIARYGYSTNLIIWEFWNEIDHPKWCQDWTFVENTVAEWHREMGEYIRNHDPYHHLISTSFSHENNQPLIWNLKEIDVVQAHNYGGSGNLAVNALEITAGLKNAFPGKPMFISEFGTDFHGYTKQGGAEEVGIHNAIWASALSGATGIAQWWWWNTLDENDLYFHYNNLGIFTENIPWLDCRETELVSNEPDVVATGLDNRENAWIWVHNTHNNWENAKSGKPVKALAGIKITMEDLSPGRYLVREFDPYGGEYDQGATYSFDTSPGIEINRLVKDKAFYVQRTD